MKLGIGSCILTKNYTYLTIDLGMLRDPDAAMGAANEGVHGLEGRKA